MDEIPTSEFDSSNFDAKKVVQHYRKLVPLPQLQRSLRAQHAAARQELVELINEKYADFVSLSSRMQGVERALKPLRAPLEESSELTKNLQGKLGGILDQANETQKELARIRARKDALTAYIDNAKILDRAKQVLAQRWGNPQESDDSLREHVAQENVARDLRRIRLNLGGRLRAAEPAITAAASTASGMMASTSRPSASPAAPAEAAAGESPSAGALAEEASPECQALLREAALFEEEFAGKLHERLRALLGAAKRVWEPPPPPPGGAASGAAAPRPPGRAELLALAYLSRALVTSGRASLVEAAFAEVFAKGALDQATAACGAAAERQEAGHGSGLPERSVLAVDLGPFFATVQEKLLVEGAPIMWFAKRLQSIGSCDGGDAENSLLVVPSLHLVPNAVAAPVLRHLQKVWEKSVFMPAFPDIFASNYLHAARFIQAAEVFMTDSERQAFAQSSAVVDFRKRWKTQVYFSLRQKEALKLLQAVAAKPLLPAASADQRHEAGGAVYWLEASAEVVRLLHTIWSDRWYLEVLFSKMLQLALELLAKCAKLLGSAADVQDGSGVGWDAAAASPSWSTSSPPVRLSRVVADISELCTALCSSGPAGVGGTLAGLVLQRLPAAAAAMGSGRRPEDLVRALLDEAIGELRPIVDRLEAGVLRAVGAAVTPQFAAIRGIPALYRMLSKPVPANPSPYVDSAMRPILALRQAAAAAPAATVARWAQQAVDAAAVEFSAQATQLLESTKLQEASLRRLGNRAAGGGGDSQATDLDKIHIQICLDVEAFTQSALALGASLEGSTGLAKLAAVVAPIRATVEAHRVPAAVQAA